MMRVPILRLGRILLTSIQSDLSDEQALQLQTDILKLFADGKADGLVIDITAVDVIDSYMARVLNETAKMVGIMGRGSCPHRNAANGGGDARRDGTQHRWRRDRT